MERKTFYIENTLARKCPQQIIDAVKDFDEEIATLEKKEGLSFIIFKDGKSNAFYIECHINADVALPLIDFEPALDIEEQPDYKANRDLQPLHKAYIQMQNDAKTGRQFSDLIIEYNNEYKKDKPLKLLGGQHRAKSIELALKDKNIIRPHGFKIYFALTMEQRAEIAQISNTNIQISLDLIDRLAETKLGPRLRDFYQKVGLLKPNQDFADRRNPNGIITTRLARTFLVNFLNGTNYRNGNDLNDKVFDPYLCKTGGIDSVYEKIIKNKKIWDSDKLIEAGKNFSELHKKQIQAIEKDPVLKKYNEFRNKAISAAVISSWALVAGLLQKYPNRLKKFYSLVKESKKDPLNAKAMSEARHVSDPPTYRGLATRSDKKDKGRTAQLFLFYSDLQDKKKGIDEDVIDTAIAKYEANKANEEFRKKERKLK